MTPQNVFSFWFEEIDPQLWFTKDDSFDELIRTRFSLLHESASKGELYEWRKTPEGRLAEIIILDQFSRNMFRGTPKSFQFDAQALTLAQEAVLQGDDKRVSLQERSFFYMPYMHSESSMIHAEAVRLFSQAGLENSYRFELAHKKIIDQFGRYPHRNAILNRISTLTEIEFMKTNSGF